jgi:ribonuclease J
MLAAALSHPRATLCPGSNVNHQGAHTTYYIIHRGQHEIGGMCIEVDADDGTRILLDLGMPLTTPGGGDFPWDTPQRPTDDLIAEGVLRDIPGVFPHDPTAPAVAAIILTHSHLDHYGLAHHAHPAIPVYGSEGTIAVLEVGRVFFPTSALPADLRPMPVDETLRFGGLSVTAIPVDHSAPDSRALLIEADGQRLLYTGDLRAHGRTGFRFANMLRDERLRGVDWLLIEGTTLSSSGETHGLSSEADVEEKLVALARGGHGKPAAAKGKLIAAEGKLVAVVASGQNVDRLVSCYRAAKRSDRLLVIDPYQAYVLMKLTPLSKNIPQFTWDGVRVLFAPHQVELLKQAGKMDLVIEMRDAGKVMSTQGKVSSDQLAAEPERYLMCCRGSYGVTKVFDKIGPEKVELVWSMWSGYWERERCAMRTWATRRGLEPHFIHSGGHAWPEDLRELVKAIHPIKTVWVHTDRKDPDEAA